MILWGGKAVKLILIHAVGVDSIIACHVGVRHVTMWCVSYIVRHLMLLLGLMLLLAGGVCPAAGKWEIYDVGGVKYVKLNDVWKFYRFSPKTGHPGCVSYGAANRVVSVKPERQDFYVNNYRYILSYPVRRHGEDLLISAIDMKKLVDPVLRPRYSKNAGVLRTVVLDPGHGGHDAGAVSPWAREKDCNLKLANKVKLRLERMGFRVVMTRSSDVFLTLDQRVEIANRTPDSVFVSIHHNSGRRAAQGIETFTLAPQGTTSPFAKTRRYADLDGNDQDSENIALATAIHSRAIKSTKATDRGIQRARFSVLCTIKRPAVLFEGGFVSNPEEGRLIASDAYQNKLADSIAEGVLSYSRIVGGHKSGLKHSGRVPAATPKRTGTSRGSSSIHGNSNYRGTTRL